VGEVAANSGFDNHAATYGRPCGGPPRAEASACAALSAAMLRQGIITVRQGAVLILIAELTLASALDFAYFG